jgi:hypothetical protein
MYMVYVCDPDIRYGPINLGSEENRHVWEWGWGLGVGSIPTPNPRKDTTHDAMLDIAFDVTSNVAKYYVVLK